MKHLHHLITTLLLCGITTLSLAKTPVVVKKGAHPASATASAHAVKAKTVKAKSPAGKTAAKKAVKPKTRASKAKADQFDNPNSKGPGLEAF